MSATDTTAARCQLVVLIPDGAAEPGEVTSLARADTPHLDALAARQGIGPLQVIPAGWHPGTETGAARLLGLAPTSPPSRGWLDAAALEVEVPAGGAAWRLDVRRGVAEPRELARRLTAVTAASVDVHLVGGGRHVLVGPAHWGDAALGHDQPMPTAWHERLTTVAAALDVDLHAWGTAARPHLRVRDDLSVHPASGAVLGLVRLAGGEVLTSRSQAWDRIRTGAAHTVVVHDGGPDEAAHACDAAAKVAALERFDAEVVGPAVAAAATVGAEVMVAPDHGGDPSTGRHTADPVPATWPGAPGTGPMTESSVGGLVPVDAAEVLAGLRRTQEVVA